MGFDSREMRLYTAIVSDVDDPKHQGRIRVVIPELGGTVISWGWAEHAGMSSAMHIPESGDVVVVAVDGEKAVYMGTLRQKSQTAQYDASFIGTGATAVLDGTTLLNAANSAANNADVPNNLFLALIAVASGWDPYSYDSTSAQEDWAKVSPILRATRGEGALPASIVRPEVAGDVGLWGRYGLAGVRLLSAYTAGGFDVTEDVQALYDVPTNLRVGAYVLKACLYGPEPEATYDAAIARYRFGITSGITDARSTWPAGAAQFVDKVLVEMRSLASQSTTAPIPVPAAVVPVPASTGTLVVTRGAPPYTYPGTMVSPGSFAAPEYAKNRVTGGTGPGDVAVHLDATPENRRAAIVGPNNSGIEFAENGQRSETASSALSAVGGPRRSTAVDVVDVATGYRQEETEGTCTTNVGADVRFVRGAAVATIGGPQTTTVRGAWTETAGAGRAMKVAGVLRMSAADVQIGSVTGVSVAGLRGVAISTAEAVIVTAGKDVHVTSSTGIVNLGGVSTGADTRERIVLAPALDSIVKALEATMHALVALQSEATLIASKPVLADAAATVSTAALELSAALNSGMIGTKRGTTLLVRAN